MLELYLALLFIPTAAIAIWERSLRLFDIRSWNAYRITGIVGTPVHELSHIVACMAFRMPVTKVILFSPNPMTGQLGEVQFRYRNGSVLHVVGRLMQAIAPLITGSIMMMLFFDISTFVNYGQYQSSVVIWIGVVAIETLSQSYAMLTNSPSDFLLMAFITCVAMHAIPSRADVFIGVRALITMCIMIGLVLVIGEIGAGLISRYSPWIAQLAHNQQDAVVLGFAVDWMKSFYFVLRQMLLWCIAGATSVLTLALTANFTLVVIPAAFRRVWLKFARKNQSPAETI